MNKKLLIGSGIAAFSLAALVGLGTVNAQESNANSLVEKIAQRFNLNKDDVQKVFDENKAERHAEMDRKYEEMLAQAVKDGKLTEDQKNKILAKHKELRSEMEKTHEAMKAQREEFQNKTEGERKQLMEQKRAEMEKKRAEIEAWEKQNNIPTGYLFGGKGHFIKGHGGPGHTKPAF